MPGRITVQRSPEGGRDRFRAYRVLVDGVEVGRVKRGERVTHDVAAGSHTVEVRIDWAGSDVVRFDVSDGALLAFECGPGGSLRRGLRDVAEAPDRYLTLRAVGVHARSSDEPGTTAP